MRDARLLSSPVLVSLLFAGACGGSTPPASTPSDTPVSAPAPEATVDAPVEKPAASDTEGWAVDDKSSGTENTARGNAAHGMPAAELAAGTKVPETRTMDVIRQLVMDNRKAARKCYEDARVNSKDLQGNVVIHFVLDPEGKVKSADLNQERSTLKAPAVVDCVIGVIKGIAFPRSSRAMETSANYPFNFTP